jgi:hypothetical protein
MSFDTHWIPALDGNDLAPCTLFDDVVAEDAKPNSREDRHRDWSLKELGRVLDRHPASRDAVWETVLAIWRLREEETAGVLDEVWKMHLTAWMVCPVVQR